MISSQTKANEQLIDYYFSAAKTGQTEVIEEFVNHGFPINQRNNMSYTALMMATYYGHTQTVDRLLALGANACLRDKRGNTAMMGAIVKAEWGIAKKLYSHTCKEGGSNQKTVEQFAAVFGQTERLQALETELSER
jgi:hypothetical protein